MPLIVLAALLVSSAVGERDTTVTLQLPEARGPRSLSEEPAMIQSSNGVVEHSVDAPQVVMFLGTNGCSKSRMGNIMFEWASLVGLAHAAGAAFCFRPAAHTKADAELFYQGFRLSRIAATCGKMLNLEDVPDKCRVFHSTYGWHQGGPTVYSQANVDALSAEVAEVRARGECQRISVKVTGCLQSWKYFESVRETVRAHLAPPPSAKASADRWLARQKESLSKKEPNTQWRFVGVQVRLGDKVHKSKYVSYCAPTSWAYFEAGMRHLDRQMTASGAGVKVVFVVTVGGGIDKKMVERDLADAKEKLERGVGRGRILFTDNKDEDIFTDLALLTSMDALVISASTFGWWAGYLSPASDMPGLVVAPYDVYRPEAGEKFTNYTASDYNPPNWKLLDNLQLEGVAKTAI